MTAIGKLIIAIFGAVLLYGSAKTFFADFTESWPIVLGITIFVVGVALLVHFLAWVIRAALPENDKE